MQSARGIVDPKHTHTHTFWIFEVPSNRELIILFIDMEHTSTPSISGVPSGLHLEL